MTSLLDLLTYAEHGAAVALLDLERNAPQKKAATLGDQHRGHVCDVTQREACQRVAEQVNQGFRSVDVLINNAGITPPDEC